MCLSCRPITRRQKWACTKLYSPWPSRAVSRTPWPSCAFTPWPSRASTPWPSRAFTPWPSRAFTPAIACLLYTPGYHMPPYLGYHMPCSLTATMRPFNRIKTGTTLSPLLGTAASSSSFRNSSTAVPCSFAEVSVYSCRGLLVQQQEVCLGRHPHRTIECTAKQTWDKKFETCAERIRKGLWAKDGKQLCTAWQREEGCTTPKHDARHACSGCGAATHGAQRCPRAQKADAADAIQG
ncbi:uncharacterized protein F5147DRAFT_680107 [Suillus discolor]|uniref:Uncharacterized protein n=1 Tax=Suillus discolor TaxID=1912936 RepID=A0A9P7FC66_9AGAM|nr:uncharacterized protein F5147DRAFT_680107 [Suillus discolor]KAG2113857.1 hypothetical protein F5147DRAFT_680107 [Suillus discolor]